MTRAILICWHQYTPFGNEFYAPMLNFFLAQMKKFEAEYDMIYLIDSTWNIDPKEIEGMKAKIIRVNPSLRYYDAYKEVLPQVEEDLVFLMDNDTVIYRADKIGETFRRLIKSHLLKDIDINLETGEKTYTAPGYGWDVVTVYDTIGTYQTNKLGGKNKFCPYWFATEKDLLMQYRDIDWAPHMPHSETLGLLTEAMLSDGVNPYEWPETKDSIYFDGHTDNDQDHVEGGRGYYSHIRAGSTVAYLLATKKYGDKETYDKYLKDQPTQELLRHCAWYQYMGGNPAPIVSDLGIPLDQMLVYYFKFTEYHGL